MLLELSYKFDSFLYGLNNNFIVTRPPVTSSLKAHYRRFMYENAKTEELKQFDETVRIRDNILKNAQNGWVSRAEIEFNDLKASYINNLWEEPILLMMQSQDWPLQAFIKYKKKYQAP